MKGLSLSGKVPDSAGVTCGVAKVGGSLFHQAELPAALKAWLAKRSGEHWVLVVGGGKLVDVIREADRTYELGEDASHWLAIAAMRVSARLLTSLLPAATLVDTWSELCQRILLPGVTVFDAEHFLREVEPLQPGRKLPAHWNVTSDSIAARLAIVLGAHQLVLLKSVAPPEHATTLEALSVAGYVDRYLPCLRDELPPLVYATLEL